MNIYDELQYAQYILENGFSKPLDGTELSVLARYFRSIGKNNKEIEDELISFCEKNVDGFSETISYPKIHTKVLRSAKRGMRIFQPIPITFYEDAKIRELKNLRYEKVVLVCLALGKYYKLTNPTKKSDTTSSYFFNTKFSKIFSMAHISQKKDENIANFLYEKEYIAYNRYYNSYQILFTNTGDISPVSYWIEDMNNIIGYYKRLCKICEKPIENANKSQSMHGLCYLNSRMIN